MTNALEVGKLQAGQSGTLLVTFFVGALGIEVGAPLVGAARRWPIAALLLGAGSIFLFSSYWTSERGTRNRADGCRRRG